MKEQNSREIVRWGKWATHSGRSSMDFPVQYQQQRKEQHSQYSPGGSPFWAVTRKPNDFSSWAWWRGGRWVSLRWGRIFLVRDHRCCYCALSDPLTPVPLACPGSQGFPSVWDLTQTLASPHPSGAGMCSVSCLQQHFLCMVKLHW